MEPAVTRLIEHLGGVKAAADAFGISQPSVSEWKRRGKLPIVRCPQAEQLTGGMFSRYELRPDFFGKTSHGQRAA